ncbi:MAG: hypothetical protein U0176_15115 [Bacteroidia bacterium]
MLILQVAERLGSLHCEDRGERKTVGGEARTYVVGTLELDEWMIWAVQQSPALGFSLS